MEVSSENAVDPKELLPALRAIGVPNEQAEILLAGIAIDAPEGLSDGSDVLVRNSKDYVSLCKCENGHLIPLRNAIG